MPPSGLLNINKSSGITSRRVVDRVGRLRRRLKVGHAGTLDPLASGVLVLCVGSATRLIEYVQRMPKRYSATFLLGRKSPTEDIEGTVVELVDPPVPALEAVQRGARSLTGQILQRPPAFSALKVAGQRAYDLARQGREVDLEPRPILVYRLEVVAYDYPELRLDIECGSGTYVRSLGRDLAESLGTAAVMSALVRTAIGEFRVEEALDPESLTVDNWTHHLLPPRRAVDALPHATLDDHQVRRIRSGQAIRCEGIPADTNEVAAVDATGELVALLTPRDPGWFRPTRVFAGTD